MSNTLSSPFTLGQVAMGQPFSPTMDYYIPQWEERTSYGFRRIDPYGKLFEERIIFLGTPISDDIANAVMAQLLCLETMNPDQDISIYINSPGGSFTALTAIYDTMRFVKPDVQTVCLGQAASAAAIGAGDGSQRQTPRGDSDMNETNFSTSGIFGNSRRIVSRARSVLSLDLKAIRYALRIASTTGLATPRRLRPSKFNPRSRARSPVALQYGGTSLETIEPAPRIAPVPIRTN